MTKRSRTPSEFDTIATKVVAVSDRVVRLIEKRQRTLAESKAILATLQRFEFEPAKPTPARLRAFKVLLRGGSLADVSVLFFACLPPRVRNALQKLDGGQATVLTIVRLKQEDAVTLVGINTRNIKLVKGALGVSGLRLGMTENQIKKIFGQPKT